MDRLEAMGILLKVVEQGSFSAASKILNIPLPTVSRKVSELETLLGVRLLHRTTRKLALTELGVDYVKACKRIVEQVNDAERELSGEYSEPKGELVITAPVMFGRLYILPIVTDFLSLYPSININLTLNDRNNDLYNEDIDLAVRLGSLPDSSLVATQVGTMRVVTCLSPKLLCQFGELTTPSDLNRFPCIALNLAKPTPDWGYYDPKLASYNSYHIDARLTVSDSEAAVTAAINDVGVTQQLYYQVQQALTDNLLKLVLEPYEPAPIPINLVHKSRRYMPKKMRLFLDFAAQKLREELSTKML
ncbi:LysR family transcriptional regulator [Pseudoalteromonas haloplanktis]|uniref:LysR family transcriptional regulator n=1 Tax=Pseudoalteromonas haloplanktis TaxID=228 RepID=A0ABU1B726_PSEHA|nr:LysR family transcriptional regulator [Pseudoalteromonas haloplanktis]MDQ9090364.1 LysR family transcriptional regulator [Pseudoalteromonas haloplanktis]